MYKVVREFTEDEATPQQMLDIVWDVTSYPEFVKGVRDVKVLENNGKLALATFTAGVAGMEFDYVLECKRSDSEVSWKRISGDFRDAEGCMRHLGGNRYRYENAMDPGFAVPQFMVRFILESTLPRLLREFRERARSSGGEPSTS